MGQVVWNGRAGAEKLRSWLQEKAVRSIFLVHGHSAESLFCFSFFQQLKEAGVEVHAFTDFAPNPLLASAEKGAAACQRLGCDLLVAIGGGSAMDVAKVAKLLCLQQTGRMLPLVVVPTTAGTGSEATHFAVVYCEGVKQSVQDACLLPDGVWMLPETLRGLPMYQRQATALDAFCHAFESYWSVHADAESQALSRAALGGILSFADGYVQKEAAAEAGMMTAAHQAGQAIDRTQTTAGHAMCYELTHLADIAHGHAAALCVDALCTFLFAHSAEREVTGVRGAAYLSKVLEDLRPAWGWLQERLEAWGLRDIRVSVPETEAVTRLVGAIHPTRLRNFPFQLLPADFAEMYRRILEGGHGRV